MNLLISETQKLESERRKIAEKYESKIIDLYNKNSNLLDNILRKNEINTQLDISITSRIKGLFKFERNKDLVLSPEQSMEYADKHFNRDRESFDKILERLDENKKILFKKIDDSLVSINNELESLRRSYQRIELELKKDPQDQKLSNVLKDIERMRSLP